MITHTSLDAFERRAREGKVRTEVDADLHMVAALIAVARTARPLLEQARKVQWNGYSWVGIGPCVSCGRDEDEGHKSGCELNDAILNLAAVIVSVPE